MTSITSITNAANTTVFTKLLRGLRTILEGARTQGLPETEQANELPPRLSYDVGLSDLCPDRMISTGRGAASSDLSRELMRRGF